TQIFGDQPEDVRPPFHGGGAAGSSGEYQDGSQSHPAGQPRFVLHRLPLPPLSIFLSGLLLPHHMRRGGCDAAVYPFSLADFWTFSNPALTTLGGLYWKGQMPHALTTSRGNYYARATLPPDRSAGRPRVHRSCAGRPVRPGPNSGHQEPV